jgi:predicted RNase H-like HicB family nuclease
MERTFTASVCREGNWFIAQCLEVDVASQGESEEQALANLREAIELYFEEPQATLQPKMRHVKVEVRAA